MDFIVHGADSMSNYERGLDIVGNNLANMQTTGYRAQRIVYQQSSTGNVTGHVSVVPNPGQLQATDVPTDLAVQDDGYFMVRGVNGTLYTRDGSFRMDPQGNMLFGDDRLALLGYGATDGAVNAGGPLVPLRIPLGQQTVSHGSTVARASGNLDAGAAVYVPVPESGGVLRTQMTIQDSLGIAHTVDVTFTKTAQNTWSWSLALAAGDASTLSPAQGVINFDGSGASTSPDVTLTLDPSGGAKLGQAITLTFDQLTQIAAPSEATVQADSFESGTLSSFTVATDGTITGLYSTGTTAILGRIPLAHFSNASGLRQLDNNLLASTDTSGLAEIGTAGKGALGTIQQGNLEGSNVNTTVEFARMLIAQRAFQANSRLMRTGDEMWQDVLDLKR